MIIDLNNLEDGHRRFDLLINPEDVELDVEGVAIKGDISVRGEVRKRIAQADLEGTVAFAADIDCTRCLKPVPKSFLFNFVVSFVTPEHFSSAKEKEVASEDLSTDVLTGSGIDLNEVVREQILLNLPERVFCIEECRGLCPICGADRNLIDCNCEENEPDPRWSALKNLK